jgi:hypothetical protein
MCEAYYSIDGVNYNHTEMIGVLEEAQARGLLDQHGNVVIYTHTEFSQAPRSFTVNVDMNQKKTIRGFYY